MTFDFVNNVIYSIIAMPKEYAGKTCSLNYKVFDSKGAYKEFTMDVVVTTNIAKTNAEIKENG